MHVVDVYQFGRVVPSKAGKRGRHEAVVVQTWLNTPSIRKVPLLKYQLNAILIILLDSSRVWGHLLLIPIL